MKRLLAQRALLKYLLPIDVNPLADAGEAKRVLAGEIPSHLIEVVMANRAHADTFIFLNFFDLLFWLLFWLFRLLHLFRLLSLFRFIFLVLAECLPRDICRIVVYKGQRCVVLLVAVLRFR